MFVLFYFRERFSFKAKEQQPFDVLTKNKSCYHTNTKINNHILLFICPIILRDFRNTIEETNRSHNIGYRYFSLLFWARKCCVALDFCCYWQHKIRSVMSPYGIVCRGRYRFSFRYNFGWEIIVERIFETAN